jgi:hypothetical protein
MDLSLLRRLGRKAAVSGYAAYKWVETHTDDVQRFADKSIERSRGKNHERFVTPAATAAKKIAEWIDKNGGSSGSVKRKKK